MGRPAAEGDSPLVEKDGSPVAIPSNTRHAKSGMNPGGPPPKAKYKLMTDSAQVARVKGEKNPF